MAENATNSTLLRRKQGSSTNSATSALALIILFGLVGSTVFALFEQRAAAREQQLVFDQTAQQVADVLSRGAQARVEELSTAANFMAEAGPVDQEVFGGFLRAEEHYTSNNSADPGVMLIEFIRRGDLEAVVAAEHAAGNTDFAITSFASSADAEMLVVTRTAIDAVVEGVRVRGLDIVPFRAEMLGPGDLPVFGQTVNWIEPVGLVSTVSGVAEGDLERLNTDLYDVTAVLIRPVVVGDVSSGWVVRFVNSQQLLGDSLASIPDGMNVRLQVDHIDGVVADLRPDPDLDFDDANLQATEFIQFATAGWTVDVWTSDDYLLPTGLFDQTVPWAIGLSLTAIAACLDFFIRRDRHRLSTAEFELDHARTLASTDVLTGLLNRQGLIDSSRVLTADTPATLYFVDLDGFKNVNDSDGHEAGDRLLQQVASKISSLFRTEDVVARLGGDEFVVFVPGVSEAVVRRIMAERIVAAVSSVDARVTCSLGVATRDPGASFDVKTMLRAADAAMYSAKRSGGDRFVVAG